MPPERAELRTLIGEGCWAFFSEIFGAEWVEALAPHHKEAIEWHWVSRIAFLSDERPQHLAYFPIWPRGHQKTTIAERLAVADGMLSLAYDKPGFCLFIGREKHKVKENIGNIEALLSSAKVREYAPELSQVAKNDETNTQRQWTATFLHTQAKYVYKGGSIESTQAGSRIEQTRPTLQIFDDIDGREDSAPIAETRFKRLTGEIIPMRQANTLAFFAQNLISKYSVMYRIQSQQVQVLTNRKPTVPIPAVKNLVTDQRTDPQTGLIRDFYVSGESTWPAWDAQRIQDEIDSEGLPAFLRECQHEVADDKTGRVHKAYNDDVHAISYSQFESVYGKDAWKDWHKVVANDWARTKTKYHANVAGFLAVASANTRLPGITFMVPYSFPEDAQPADVAIRLLGELTPYAYGENGNRATWRQLADEAWKKTNAHQHFDSDSERLDYQKNYYSKIIPKYSRQVLSAYKVRSAVMSHSEDKVRDMFNTGFGFTFEPSNPGKHEGLESIEAAMRVDYEVPHLFKEGMGYTRFYVLCPDDKTREAVDGIYPPIPFPEAIKPDALHDSDLFRYQMVERRFQSPKLTVGGEIIGALEKTNDDFGQMLQMVYTTGNLTNIRLDKYEKFDAEMQVKGLSKEAISQIPDETEQIAKLTVRMVEERAFGQKQKTKGRRIGVPNFTRRGSQ